MTEVDATAERELLIGQEDGAGRKLEPGCSPPAHHARRPVPVRIPPPGEPGDLLLDIEGAESRVIVSIPSWLAAVEVHGGTDQRLERRLVNAVALVDVNGAAGLGLETITETYDSPALVASAALARGAVELARGTPRRHCSTSAGRGGPGPRSTCRSSWRGRGR